MNTPFKIWLEKAFTLQAAQLRMQLKQIVDTAQSYANGNKWEKKHYDIILQLITECRLLPIGKYPGEVTEEEKQYYRECHKPNEQIIKLEFITQIPKPHSQV